MDLSLSLRELIGRVVAHERAFANAEVIPAGDRTVVIFRSEDIDEIEAASDLDTDAEDADGA